MAVRIHKQEVIISRVAMSTRRRLLQIAVVLGLALLPIQQLIFGDAIGAAYRDPGRVLAGISLCFAMAVLLVMGIQRRQIWALYLAIILFHIDTLAAVVWLLLVALRTSWPLGTVLAFTATQMLVGLVGVALWIGVAAPRKQLVEKGWI